MMITNCAKMRSFNCFTLIIGTVPPRAPSKRLPSPPNEQSISTRCAAGRQSRTAEARARERADSSRGTKIDLTASDFGYGGVYPQPWGGSVPERAPGQLRFRGRLGSRGGVSGGALAIEVEPQ